MSHRSVPFSCVFRDEAGKQPPQHSAPFAQPFGEGSVDSPERRALFAMGIFELIKPTNKPKVERQWVWTKDAPDELLILINAGRAVVLNWCGRAAEWYADCDPLQKLVDDHYWDDLDAGLWVTPVRVTEHHDWETGVVEQDLVLENSRRLTELEWEWFTECPVTADVWDPKFKMKYPEPDDVAADHGQTNTDPELRCGDDCWM